MIEVTIYYLEQEVYSPTLKQANEPTFEQALSYLRLHGHESLKRDQVRAIMAAAERRGRLDDLEDAIITYKEVTQCQSTE